MQESYPFSFRTNPWDFIDEANAPSAASVERSIDIVNSEADVVYPRTASREKLPDGSILSIRLEQLDQALASGECSDLRTVRIAHFSVVQAEYLPVERELLGDRLNGYPNVCDSSAFWGSILH